MKFLLSAFAGGVLLASSALATSTMAQTLVPPASDTIVEHDGNAPIPTPGDDTANPNANVRASQDYDKLVTGDRSFRDQRMHKECDSIDAVDLRQECMASFGSGASNTGSSGMSDRSGNMARQPRALTPKN
jgi:hypothetical protein